MAEGSLFREVGTTISIIIICTAEFSDKICPLSFFAPEFVKKFLGEANRFSWS